jgi:hypothetical protein
MLVWGELLTDPDGSVPRTTERTPKTGSSPGDNLRPLVAAFLSLWVQSQERTSHEDIREPPRRKGRRPWMGINHLDDGGARHCDLVCGWSCPCRSIRASHISCHFVLVLVRETLASPM